MYVNAPKLRIQRRIQPYFPFFTYNMIKFKVLENFKIEIGFDVIGKFEFPKVLKVWFKNSKKFGNFLEFWLWVWLGSCFCGAKCPKTLLTSLSRPQNFTKFCNTFCVLESNLLQSFLKLNLPNNVKTRLYLKLCKTLNLIML